jgi:hypothetical protein
MPPRQYRSRKQSLRMLVWREMQRLSVWVDVSQLAFAETANIGSLEKGRGEQL